ncbi:MAG: ATP-binding cassette domain-containing protein, partial [Clostridiales bacterium]|nr:ATP-binding cassette domain-containing protein [Clostridiales bacterium]
FYNNISFGVENATMEQVIEAAKIANAHDFIMASENGYDTMIGDRGGKLSGGQRRRIDIARALLHEPKILILDEPTTGLDPQTRRKLWNVVAQLRRDANMTVFLTTHYMEEAADADYVVILDSGRIAAEGTPLQLKNAYTGDFITLYGLKQEQVEQLGRPYEELRGAYRAAVPNTAAATRLILEHAEIFQDYEITKGGMDDVFLAVTGKSLEGGLPQHKGGEKE